MIEIKKIKQLFPKKRKHNSKRLLCVFAHPDDESLNIGGLLAKAKKEGIFTYLVCLTQGGKGAIDPKLWGKSLGKKRVRELTLAGEILGIKKIFACDFPDGKLVSQQKKIKKRLKEIMVQIKPQIVITHDPGGASGHPDHITTSMMVKSVVKKFNEKINLYFVVLGGGLKQIMKKIRGERINWQKMPAPTHWLNIAPFAHIKEKACLAHQSQQMEQSRPVPLKVWYSFFDKEYLHLVNLKKRQ